MEWMLMPLKRYADFSGRSRRKEYWMFALLMVIVNLLLYTVIGGAALGSSDNDAGLAAFGSAVIAAMILGLIFLIPSIAVAVRRFHDQDKSGWFVLLGLIPYLGWLILIVFMCLDGTRGPNRFGPDPKAGEASA